MTPRCNGNKEFAMKYHRAVREFIASKLNAISADDLNTFAQAYAKDRTKTLNAPTQARLKREFDAVLSKVKSGSASALAVPPCGRGSFTRTGAVSTRRPGARR